MAITPPREWSHLHGTVECTKKRHRQLIREGVQWCWHCGRLIENISVTVTDDDQVEFKRDGIVLNARLFRPMLGKETIKVQEVKGGIKSMVEYHFDTEGAGSRVIFDYDDMTFEDVIVDLFYIAPLWFPYAKRLEVFETSERNYHAVLETVWISREDALDILNASKCSLDYKAFVAERGFTRRVSAKRTKPAPTLVFSVATGHHYVRSGGPIWRNIKHPSPPTEKPSRSDVGT